MWFCVHTQNCSWKGTLMNNMGIFITPVPVILAVYFPPHAKYFFFSSTEPVIQKLFTLLLIVLVDCCINPLNTKLNPTWHLLTLLGANHILHVSRIRVNGSPPSCATTFFSSFFLSFDVLTSYISCRWGLNTEKCDVMRNVTIHQSQHSCQG
jgi:hypothetical protein